MKAKPTHNAIKKEKVSAKMFPIVGPRQRVARKVAARPHPAPDRELEGVDGAPIRQRQLRAAAVQDRVCNNYRLKR